MAVQGSCELHAGGATLSLLPQRAVWLARERCLLVADLHLGKAVSFRRLGVPVPKGTSTTNLERLSALVSSLEVRHLVLLGDFLHSALAHADSTLGALGRWRATQPQLDITLVRGNHDDRAGDPPPWLGARCVDEPFILPATDLALCHHPQRVDGKYVAAGHLHPCVSVGRGFERLRLPCFHEADSVLTLPAFGEFTGMHPVARQARDRIWAVAEDRVLALP